MSNCVDDDVDIYSDLNIVSYKDELKELKEQNCLLQKQVNELKLSFTKASQEKEQFKNACANLNHNISSLLKTAQAELRRKDSLISELRERCNKLGCNHRFQQSCNPGYPIDGEYNKNRYLNENSTQSSKCQDRSERSKVGNPSFDGVRGELGEIKYAEKCKENGFKYDKSTSKLSPSQEPILSRVEKLSSRGSQKRCDPRLDRRRGSRENDRSDDLRSQDRPKTNKENCSESRHSISARNQLRDPQRTVSTDGHISRHDEKSVDISKRNQKVISPENFGNIIDSKRIESSIKENETNTIIENHWSRAPHRRRNSSEKKFSSDIQVNHSELDHGVSSRRRGSREKGRSDDLGSIDRPKTNKESVEGNHCHSRRRSSEKNIELGAICQSGEQTFTSVSPVASLPHGKNAIPKESKNYSEKDVPENDSCLPSSFDACTDQVDELKDSIPSGAHDVRIQAQVNIQDYERNKDLESVQKIDGAPQSCFNAEMLKSCEVEDSFLSCKPNKEITSSLNDKNTLGPVTPAATVCWNSLTVEIGQDEFTENISSNLLTTVKEKINMASSSQFGITLFSKRMLSKMSADKFKGTDDLITKNCVSTLDKKTEGEIIEPTLTQAVNNEVLKNEPFCKSEPLRPDLPSIVCSDRIESFGMESAPLKEADMACVSESIAEPSNLNNLSSDLENHSVETVSGIDVSHASNAKLNPLNIKNPASKTVHCNESLSATHSLLFGESSAIKSDIVSSSKSIAVSEALNPSKMVNVTVRERCNSSACTNSKETKFENDKESIFEGAKKESKSTPFKLNSIGPQVPKKVYKKVRKVTINPINSIYNSCSAQLKKTTRDQGGNEQIISNETLLSPENKPFVTIEQQGLPFKTGDDEKKSSLEKTLSTSEATDSSSNKTIDESYKSKLMESIFGSPLKWIEDDSDSRRSTLYFGSPTRSQKNTPSPLSRPVNQEAITLSESNEKPFINLSSSSSEDTGSPAAPKGVIEIKESNRSSHSGSSEVICESKVMTTALLKYDDSHLGQFDDTIQFISALSTVKPRVSPLGTPEKSSDNIISVKSFENTTSPDQEKINVNITKKDIKRVTSDCAKVTPFCNLEINQDSATSGQESKEVDDNSMNENRKHVTGNCGKEKAFSHLNINQDCSFNVHGTTEKPVNVLTPRKVPRKLKTPTTPCPKNVRISCLDNKAIATVCHLVSALKDNSQFKTSPINKKKEFKTNSPSKQSKIIVGEVDETKAVNKKQVSSLHKISEKIIVEAVPNSEAVATLKESIDDTCVGNVDMILKGTEMKQRSVLKNFKALSTEIRSSVKKSLTCSQVNEKPETSKESPKIKFLESLPVANTSTQIFPKISNLTKTNVKMRKPKSAETIKSSSPSEKISPEILLDRLPKLSFSSQGNQTKGSNCDSILRETAKESSASYDESNLKKSNQKPGSSSKVVDDYRRKTIELMRVRSVKSCEAGNQDSRDRKTELAKQDIVPCKREEKINEAMVDCRSPSQNVGKLKSQVTFSSRKSPSTKGSNSLLKTVLAENRKSDFFPRLQSPPDRSSRVVVERSPRSRYYSEKHFQNIRPKPVPRSRSRYYYNLKHYRGRTSVSRSKSPLSFKRKADISVKKTDIHFKRKREVVSPSYELKRNCDINLRLRDSHTCTKTHRRVALSTMTPKSPPCDSSPDRTAGECMNGLVWRLILADNVPERPVYRSTPHPDSNLHHDAVDVVSPATPRLDPSTDISRPHNPTPSPAPSTSSSLSLASSSPSQSSRKLIIRKRRTLNFSDSQIITESITPRKPSPSLCNSQCKTSPVNPIQAQRRQSREVSPPPKDRGDNKQLLNRLLNHSSKNGAGSTRISSAKKSRYSLIYSSSGSEQEDAPRRNKEAHKFFSCEVSRHQKKCEKWDS